MSDEQIIEELEKLELEIKRVMNLIKDDEDDFDLDKGGYSLFTKTFEIKNKKK